MIFDSKKAKKAAAKAAAKAAKEGTAAFRDARDYLGPRTEQARKQIVSAVSDAKEKVTPYVEQAIQKAAPVAQDALHNVNETFHNEVCPKLHELWEQAYQNPQVKEATNRGMSTIAALRGDLALPERKLPGKPKKSFATKLLSFIGIAAVIAGIVVVVKTILGSEDDGWAPQDSDDDADWPKSPLKNAAAKVKETVAEAKDKVSEKVSDLADKGEELGEAAKKVSDEAKQGTEDAKDYGEGSFVGSEPPEGYVIKGNERSMKYHVPDAAGYDRTNADVWFASEEAAEKAGFTRALR